MGKSIYREKSLTNLSSPEQLDLLVQNVSSKGKIALFTLFFIVFITLLWSIYGTIQTKVKGNGILLKKSGISKINATTSGMIEKVYIKNSQKITKGDLIATVNYPKKLLQIDAKKDILNKLYEKYIKTEFQSKQDLALSFERFQEEKNQLKLQLIILQLKIKNLHKRISNQDKLYKKGLITSQVLLENNELLLQTKRKLNNVKSSLVLKNIEAFAKKRERQNNLDRLKRDIVTGKRELRSLEKDFKLVNEIRSNFTGKILGISISDGSVISIGTHIAEIEQINKHNDLEAVFFVSAMEGKMIEKGFRSQVSPSIVKKEEFGFIQSDIKYVSTFPATKEAIMNILNNNELTNLFLKFGPPIIVYAKLHIDSNTFSGFKWSSRKGPPIYITSGTLCTVEVTVKEQAPISLVIPYLKKRIGL